MKKMLLLLATLSAARVFADTPSATVTAIVTNSANNSVTVTSGKNGVLPLVSTNPGETVSVQIQFPAALAGASLTVQALDGGSTPDDNYDLSIADDGTVSLVFKVGAKNGLYRVSLVSGSSTATLQFWVPDPSTQSTNDAAVTP